MSTDIEIPCRINYACRVCALCVCGPLKWTRAVSELELVASSASCRGPAGRSCRPRERAAFSRSVASADSSTREALKMVGLAAAAGPLRHGDRRGVAAV